MAEILQGDSGTSSLAPLTQAQTVAICRHLQEQIRNVETDLMEVKREQQHSCDHIQLLESKTASTCEDVHNLQLGLSATDISLETLSREYAQTGTAMADLQAGHSAMKDILTTLEEARAMADTGHTAFLQELRQGQEDHKRLSVVVDKVVNEDLKDLHRDIAHMRLALKQLSSDQQGTSLMSRQSCNGLRDTRNDLEACFNEIKKSNAVASILENRLKTTAKGVQLNFSKFDELNGNLIKISDGFEHTNARIWEVETSIKVADDVAGAMQHELQERTRKIEVLEDKLEKATKLLEEVQIAGDDFREQLNSVQVSCDNSSRRIVQMQRELQELSCTVLQNRAGLKEQSALLLPNIHLDSPETQQTSARHGSLLTSTPPSNQKSMPANAIPRLGNKNASPTKAWALEQS